MLKKKVFAWVLFLSIFISCASSKKEAKERLDQLGIEYNEINFYSAVTKYEFEVVILFLEAGMSLGVKENDMTVLVEAARRKHTEIALALIDAGAVPSHVETLIEDVPKGI